MPRNDDEDDDRPRKRRRPSDDDEDDRPRSRRRPPDDDDRPPAGRRARDEDADDEDDHDDRPRSRRRKQKQPQVSITGVAALVTGALALGMSFTCFGGLAVIPALIGLVLGLIGYLNAQKSRGRQSPLLPIGGGVVSLAATVVSVIAIVSFVRDVNKARRDFKAGFEEAGKKWEQEWEKAEAQRKKDLARAAGQVQAAGPGGAVQVTAAQFYKLWDDDEDRFDAVYKDKIIEITGTVDELNFAGDTYTVLLKAGMPDETVDCEFAKDPNVRARLAQLKPGDQVRIRGKCLGDGPTLEACILVE
jgi:hypothetical protein